MAVSDELMMLAIAFAFIYLVVRKVNPFISYLFFFAIGLLGFAYFTSQTGYGLSLVFTFGGLIALIYEITGMSR